MLRGKGRAVLWNAALGALAGFALVPVSAAATAARVTADIATAAKGTSSPVTIPSPTSRCSTAAVLLPAGTAVPGSDLQAVDFLSTTVGVGLTASRIACTASSAGESGNRAFPIRLAVSSDAGRSWTIEGTVAPPGAQTGVGLGPPGTRPSPAGGFAPPGMLAFVSPKLGWVEIDGQLSLTTDGGDAWQSVRLGAEPVAALHDAGGSVLAVTWGSWQLWRADTASHRWKLVSAIPVAAKTMFSTVVLGPAAEDAVVATTRYGDAPSQIAETSDAGRNWSVVPDPCHGPYWLTATALAESPDGTMAIVCLGGAAAGSADHGFYVSNARGRTWSVRAEVTNLASPGHSGLPLQDTNEVLAAPTSGRFFLETANTFSESTDGGQHWSAVVGVGSVLAAGVGGFVALDFVDPDHGWALFPGEGVIATVDGLHWKPL
jgi:hypothetical protein